MKKLTKENYMKIEHLMPKARKKPVISNYRFLCALLYIIENGCKWRIYAPRMGRKVGGHYQKNMVNGTQYI